MSVSLLITTLKKSKLLLPYLYSEIQVITPILIFLCLNYFIISSIIKPQTEYYSHSLTNKLSNMKESMSGEL